MSLSYSYSYSDTVAGTTNNATVDGLVWNMEDVLPPQAGLVVNGLIYQYTIEKDPNTDSNVHIRNEYALGEGYIIQNTDDWSQLPGSTINNYLTFGNIPREAIGEGSITVDGDGTITNSNVRYNYKFDECYIVISNPACPGYQQSLYDWLLENGLLGKEPDVNDPLYDEWVQLTLNRQTEEEDEEKVAVVSEEEDEEDDGIAALNADIDIEGFVDGARQSEIMSSFASVPNFDNYYNVTIQGGAYEETVTLNDSELPDNTRALNSLAKDSLHREMVRSQYNN